MDCPKITVITIVRNDPEGFLITARSVLSQDYYNIEWIVVDGLSTDETSHYIKKLATRFSAFKSEADSGIYNAMNKGIDMASGDWVFFMNADDVFFKKNTISEYVKRIKPDDEIVYSDVMRREDGRIHFYRNIYQIWLGMPFDHQTVLTRTEIYKTLRYDESYKIAGDFDFFSRAYVSDYKFRKLPWLIGCRKPFATGASANFVERQIERIRVLNKYYIERPWKPLLFREYKQALQNKSIDKQEFQYLKKLVEE